VTLLSILGLFLFVTACTGGGNSGLKNRNVLQYNLLGEPQKFNPITGTDAYISVINKLVLDPLLVRDYNTYEWIPQLAESYEVSPDGRKFTFKLREGAKFHDGVPVTAEDVKFSVDAIFIDEYGAFPSRPYLESIEKIEVKDERTVVFHTKDRYFKNLEVLGGLSVVPKHIYGDVEKGKALTSTIIGSGPYKVKKYERGQMIILERNQEWIGNDLPQFAGKYTYDEIVFKFPKEDAVGLQMLRRGEIDYMRLTPEQFADQTNGPEWEGRIEKEKVENKMPKGTSFVAWNFKNPLFKSKNVRLALYHLMNREEMNQKFAYGLSSLATGPWYKDNPSADPSVKPVLFDPEKAKKLLAEEGWKDEDKDGILEKTFDGKVQKFEFTIMYPSKDLEKYWVFYQNDLKKAGVNAKLQLIEWNSFIEKLDTQDFDAATLAWSSTSIFPDPKQIWHSESAVKGGSNFISYSNPEVDKLIDAARVEFDDEKRQQMMRKVYKLIAEDVPYAFMFNPAFVFYANSPRLQTKEPLTYDIGWEFWSLDVPSQSVE
jgi:microcin C transport system substrate-binding protein